MRQRPTSSSEQILRSSLLTGLGSGADLALRLIRTKAIALLLGPSGVGLISLFNAIAETIHGPAAAGFGASGVQQVARHAGSGDALRRDLFVIRALLAGLACAGALVLLLGRGPIAQLSFSDASRAGDVGLLAAVVLLTALAASNTTILQGLRRIRALAVITVTSAVISTAATVLLLLAFGERAIVPSLVVTALVTAAVSFWHVRDLPFRAPAGAWQVLLQDGRGLLALGSIFLVTHLLTVLTDYAVRLMVLQSLEIQGAGLYQAAWTLGGTYVGFVLGAMATDFYPRLSAAADDHLACNRLVNEQVEVGLLLAGPGILACLTFAPWLVSLCYSREFAPAVDLFRLLLVGMLLRVVAWPLGYILRAKRHGAAVLWTEIAKNATQLILSLLLIQRFGLVGAGLAFILTYVVCLGLMLATSRALTGFRFSSSNLLLSALHGGVLLLLFGILHAAGSGAFLACGLVATAASALYSIRQLASLGALRMLPQGMQRVLGRLAVAGGQAGPGAGVTNAEPTSSGATPPAGPARLPGDHPAPANTPSEAVPPAASAESAHPRVLVALASHGVRNLEHLRRIIATYQGMPFPVEVVVLSDRPKDLGPGVRVMVGLPTTNPWSLPFAHHAVFTAEADRHDLFVYSEDDIAVSETNLRAFLRVTPHLRDDEIAGFMRVELDADGRQSLPDVHGSYHWKPDSIRSRGGEVFAMFTNEHAAFYVLTRAQLRRAIASGGFGLPPRAGRYDMLCTAATDPYTSCGMTKLVCVSDFDRFLVRHLSGRYLGKLGPSRAAFQPQIDALLHLAAGRASPCSAFPQALDDAGPRGTKVLYERHLGPFLQAVPSSAASVLSVGCGAGAAEARLAERGAKVTAIPVDPILGAAAGALGVETIPGDLQQAFASLEQRRFDCVLISGVLHSADNPTGLVERCTRLLAPGGCLAVISPNFHALPGSWRERFNPRRLMNGTGAAQPAREWPDPRLLSRSLAHHGFTPEPIVWLKDQPDGEVSGAHSRRQVLLRRLSRLRGRLVLGRMLASTWILRAAGPRPPIPAAEEARASRITTLPSTAASGNPPR